MPVSELKLTLIDELICNFDRALRTITPNTQTLTRPSPAAPQSEPVLNDSQKKHVAGLMRVNHTGEVCAQALYQAQALTAKSDAVRQDMNHAADEEIDHLAWCEERLGDLNQRSSVFNPIWYGLSFGIGAAAGLVSDKISLGFVAATEELVSEHLESHLQSLPSDDIKSRAIVEQMLEDEREHGHQAINAGGAVFPVFVKSAMSLVSKAMTTTSYRL